LLLCVLLLAAAADLIHMMVDDCVLELAGNLTRKNMGETFRTALSIRVSRAVTLLLPLLLLLLLL
jgi:hypothetical protein